ncbi:MAG TPA: molybdenum cofactor guanylyltransferase [Acidimicrobiales bacterium]|nr:molybdenum cofactor guanylyltransferase [Acidimicrobiales bacterium]
MSGPGSFSGAVLTGGAGRRMGRDKALLALAGEPMALRVARALRAAGAAEVFAVGGDIDALAARGLVAVADERPGEGPLAGLLAALDHARHPVVAVLACDLVSPDPAAVAAVVVALETDPALAWAVPVLDGRRQLVHGAWRRSARPVLGAAFERGERSLHRAVAGLAGTEVAGIGAAALADADTPAQLPPSALQPPRSGGQAGPAAP